MEAVLALSSLSTNSYYMTINGEILIEVPFESKYSTIWHKIPAILLTSIIKHGRTILYYVPKIAK